MNTTQKHTLGVQNQGSEALQDDDFFIPDLCNSRAVIILVVVTQLFAMVVTVLETRLPAFDLMDFTLVSLLCQWITLSSAGIICTVRPFLRNLSVNLVLLSCLLIVLVDTAVFSFVGQWVVTPEYLEFESVFNIWSILQNLIIAAILSIMVFRYFLVQYQLRLQERAELNARLQSLQSRIRPHFLFNSMNIIASLIATDPDTAERVVEDLSELFRASLKEGTDLVPLKSEVDLCKKYSRIEQLRLGKRLTVNWHEVSFPAGLYEQVQIPMLLLQPLLENAIYHGIQPRAEGGVVDITFENKGDLIQVTITNPLPSSSFPSETIKQHKGNKIAVENIKNRLAAFYGEQGKLEQDQKDNEFVTVLSFPKTVLS